MYISPRVITNVLKMIRLRHRTRAANQLALTSVVSIQTTTKGCALTDAPESEFIQKRLGDIELAVYV